jgi:hypothetical protein
VEGDACCLLFSVLLSFIFMLQGVPNPDALLVVESGDEEGDASDAGDTGDAGDAGGDVVLLTGEEKSSSWPFNKS